MQSHKLTPPRKLLTLCLCAFLVCLAIPARAQLQQLTGHVPTLVKNGQAPLLGTVPSGQKMHLSIVLPIRNKPSFDLQVATCGNPSAFTSAPPGTYLYIVNNCPSMPASGYMYATSPKYGQSSTLGMSF